MKHSLGRMICAGAAALIVLAASAHGAGVAAQDAGSSHKARANTKAAPAPPPIAGAPQQKLPPRTPFSAADDAVAAIPGMPDARFWADSKTDFEKALPPQRGEQHGSWLILSTGGSDGAFGAGLLNGLSAAGKRPDYAVVTGVSTGALMAPFVFAGPRYDAALAAVYTHTSAADIFEVGGTGESFLDTWPLRDLIAKQITPALLADIAAAHQAGRRLFIVTTNLDAGRSVVWNMGAIAVHFTEHANAHPTSPDADAAIKLFRNVLLASGSVPGAFPPVLIEVEGNGKRFAEMHVDGGVGGQFFVTPQALMQSTSTYKIPADALYVVVNSDLQPDFQVVERNTPTILAQTVAMAIKADLRVLLDRAYVAAKNSGIGFNVATIPESFNAPSRGAFDPDYMKALFNVGYDQGKGPTPFANEPPAFPAPPANGVSDPQPGANR